MKLFLGILLASFLFPAQEWVVQPIDKRVSVSFPFTPEKKLLGEEPYFNAASPAGFTCTAMSTDYSKGAPDSITLMNYMKTPEALTSTEESLVRDFVGGKILNSKTSSYAGYVMQDITLTTGKQAADGEFDVMDYRAIIVGIKLYSLYFYYDQNKPMTDTRNKFFNSFKVR